MVKPIPTKIKDMCLKVTSGGTPLKSRSDFYQGGTIPWLKTKGVKYCNIYDCEEKITELALQESSAKLIPINSVIIAMYGDGDTAGRVAVNKIPLTTNQACCNLIIDPNKADYRFIYYYLMGSYDELVNLKTGSGQQNLSASIIKEIEILLPELERQREISDILESLDLKIELNNQINETLESMAKAIFKEWFIDFGPVKAIAEGKKPFGMDDETASLFPDSFEDSELGKIPKGWEVRKITDFCSLEYGKNLPTTELQITGFPVYGAAGVIGYYERSLYKAPTVLITCRGNGSGDILETKEEAFVTNNSIAIIPRVESYRHFLRHYLKSIDTRVVVTGSAQPQITIANLSSLKLLVPNRDLYSRFFSIIEQLWLQQRSNELENKQLSVIRDLLLPKLISGEIDFKDTSNV